MDAHPNFAYSTLAASIADSDTELDVDTGTGGRFADFPFEATIWPASEPFPIDDNAEIVRILDQTGDTLEIERGRQGTTPKAFDAGDRIAVTLTRDTLDQIASAVALPETLADDETGAGTTVMKTAGETLAFGDPVYMNADGDVWIADASGDATYPAVGLALAAAVASDPVPVLFLGNARSDAWTWTVGGIVYLAAGGGLTQTQPAGSGDVVQVVGIAHPDADTLYVDPQLVYVVHT